MTDQVTFSGGCYIASRQDKYSAPVGNGAVSLPSSATYFKAVACLRVSGGSDARSN